MLFNIKHGSSANIETAQRVQGCWYVTDDTFELYYCPDGKTLVCMNKMESFDPSQIHETLENLTQQVSGLRGHKLFQNLSTRLDLPIAGSENVVYYIESEQKSYMWSDTSGKYYCIGTDYNTIEQISGGTASVMVKNNKSI